MKTSKILNHFKADLVETHQRLYEHLLAHPKGMSTYKEDIFFASGRVKRLEYYIYDNTIEDVRIQIRNLTDEEMVIGDVEDDINIIQFYLQEAIKYVNKKKKK